METGRRYARIIQQSMIYLVQIFDDFYRVRVLNTDVERKRCRCFFIDIGTKAWHDRAAIYKCIKIYKKIHPLAIQFSLFSVDCSVDNPDIEKIIAVCLTNQIVRTAVKTKADEYFYDDNNGKIAAVFHDTNGLNLNELIMEKIGENYSTPQLSKQSTNNVSISHVSKTPGRIYCHLANCTKDLEYVEKLIQKSISYGVACFFRNASQSMISNHNGKLFLVYCRDNNRWYRACVLPEPATDGTQSDSVAEAARKRTNVRCFFVDYGQVMIINSNYIYELTGILSKIPHLAILVQLHQTKEMNDDWNGIWMERIKGILSVGDRVKVDVVEAEGAIDANADFDTDLVPVVRMTRWIKLEHGNEQNCINDIF